MVTYSHFSLYGTGLTPEQRKALSQLGIEVKKFNRTEFPMGSVLVGPKFNGLIIDPNHVTVRLYEPGETGRGAYLHEVNLGSGQRIRQLFQCPFFLLNQQRAREYPLSLEVAEDILHWGDHDSKIFKAIMHSWKHRDCKICSKTCLEVLTARSLDMIRYCCPDPAVLTEEFAEKGRWIADGPYLRFHAPECWECREIVRTLTREAEDTATRERLAELISTLAQHQFSPNDSQIILNSHGLRTEIDISDRILKVVIYEGQATFSSPDRLRMVVEHEDGTQVDSSDLDPRNSLYFVISLERMKKLPFGLQIIPAEKSEP